MKRLLGLVAALLLIPSSALAAPAAPSGSIAIDQPGPYAFGDAVTFTTSTDGLKGSQYPMVYVACYQGVEKVWGNLRSPDTVFTLGSGSNDWARNGGPADCEAWLYAYGAKRHGIWVVDYLAGPVLFHAEG